LHWPREKSLARNCGVKKKEKFNARCQKKKGGGASPTSAQREHAKEKKGKIANTLIPNWEKQQTASGLVSSTPGWGREEKK